jgi:dephospho-CoA kinase
MFGQAGTGKDTVATIMDEKHRIKSLALADPIRSEYQLRTGRTDYKQNRPLMIRIGETYKELYGQDVWCRAALDHIQQMGDEFVIPPRGYLIRDGRYQHEYDFFVRAHGFTPIRLTADMGVRLTRLRERDGLTQLDALEYESAHFVNSESFGYTLENNGTLPQLQENISKLLVTVRDYEGRV